MKLNGREVDTLTIQADRIVTDATGIVISFKVTLHRKGKVINEIYYQKLGSDSLFYIEAERLKVYSSLPIESPRPNGK